MASEVGSAYVTLLPSAKGFAAKMQKELASEVSKVGKGIGEDLGEKVGDEGGEEAATSFGSRFKKGLGKLSAMAGGVAIGATLAKGISDALSAGSMTAKLDAQLGLTGKQAGRAGKVAGNLFGSNYGDSMEQVNEAIGFVIRDIDGMRGASESSLERISTKALNTANIFDQDLGATTRAVSQMMRTGLAKDADHAFDILTKGFQSGADKSEDLLDTMNEYGTQFRKMGIDGETATGLISQGLKAGARDGDTVADAIKEFSIRAVDGTDASAEGFRSLGLNAKAMTDQIAKGGKPAAQGLQTVLDKLRGIKDPVKREAAAVALFGTKAEDLGTALYKLDPSTAAKGLGKVGGAADEANKAFNDTPAARVQAFIRQLQQGLTNAMSKYVIPAIDTLTPLLSALAGGLGNVVGPVKDLVGWFRDHETVTKTLGVVIGSLIAVTAAHAAVTGFSLAAIKAWVVQSRIASAVARVWAAVQWVLNAAMSANPIGLIVLAVAALVAIIAVIVHKTVGWGNVWEWLKGVVGSAWEAIKSAFGKIVDAISAAVSWVWAFIKKWWYVGLLALLLGPFGLLVGLVVKHWDKIKAAFGRAWSAIKSVVSRGVTAVVGFVKGLPGKALDALRSLGSKLRDLFSRVWEGVKTVTVRLVENNIQFYSKLPGRLLGALKSIGSKLADLFRRAWDSARDAVSNGIDSVVNFVRRLPGRLLSLGSSFLQAGRDIIGKFVDGMRNAAGVISGIAGNVWDTLRGLINGAINAINGALEFRINLPGPRDININPPNIPTLATGGRVTGATLALIGEGREPETVLPDSLLRGLLERTAAAGAGAGQVAELTITNWEQGTGYFRLVADGAVSRDARFRRNLGAMNA